MLLYKKLLLMTFGTTLIPRYIEYFASRKSIQIYSLSEYCYKIESCKGVVITFLTLEIVNKV